LEKSGVQTGSVPYKPKFSANKFKELMLYIADQCRDDEYFGKVKLAKCLFFSDFYAYEKTGEPITGATYKRLPQGPVPDEFEAMAKALHEQHDALYMPHRFPDHKTEYRLIPQRPVNSNWFSAAQLSIVDDVVRKLYGKNAHQVSDLSHIESVGWRIARRGDVIPYEAVFLSDRRPTEKDKQRAKELARKHGWTTGGGR
jgi:Protein of unknown function (DUF4065)